MMMMIQKILTHVEYKPNDKLYRSDYQFNLIYFIIIVIINKYEHVFVCGSKKVVHAYVTKTAENVEAMHFIRVSE